ncbi:MAG: pyrroline-5-carboxylate reductase [Nitrospiraceae bacterium]|nr:pyrroline-5-carboxylate reductase [Nitrospiraceae bacterium]
MTSFGFIGGGNMAEALIKGMRSKGDMDILVSEPMEQRRKYLEETYGVRTTASNHEAAEEAELVIIAVKPQIIGQALTGMKEIFGGGKQKQKLAISIAAGIRLDYLVDKLGTENVVRAMPNTPALAGLGMTVLSVREGIFPSEGLDARLFARAKEIFMSVGKVLVMPEKHMDAVTALSGSGPAFFALFIEGLVEGAIRQGLPQEAAAELALQTAAGSLKMLEEGMDTAMLRKMVTSPGGTTQAGLDVLESRGFKDILYDTIEAAARRAEELARGF